MANLRGVGQLGARPAQDRAGPDSPAILADLQARIKSLAHVVNPWVSQTAFINRSSRAVSSCIRSRPRPTAKRVHPYVVESGRPVLAGLYPVELAGCHPYRMLYPATVAIPGRPWAWATVVRTAAIRAVRAVTAWTTTCSYARRPSLRLPRPLALSEGLADFEQARASNDYDQEIQIGGRLISPL